MLVFEMVNFLFKWKSNFRLKRIINEKLEWEAKSLQECEILKASYGREIIPGTYLWLWGEIHREEWIKKR